MSGEVLLLLQGIPQVQLCIISPVKAPQTVSSTEFLSLGLPDLSLFQFLFNVQSRTWERASYKLQHMGSVVLFWPFSDSPWFTTFSVHQCKLIATSIQYIER